MMANPQGMVPKDHLLKSQTVCEFQVFKDDRETLKFVKSEVAAVREYRDRLAYGGMTEVSEVSLKNGQVCRLWPRIEEDFRRVKWPPL
jgi:hypothetical protein